MDNPRSTFWLVSSWFLCRVLQAASRPCSSCLSKSVSLVTLEAVGVVTLNSTGEPQGGWWALGPWVHNLPRSHMEVELNFRVPSEGKAPNKGEQEGGVPSSQQCGTNGRGQPTGGTRGTGQGRPETLNVHTKLDNPGNWPT